MLTIRKNIITFTVLFFALTIPLFSEQFRFKFSVGDEQKISSVVNEDVYVDGVFSHSSEIVNRIVARVVQTKEEDDNSRASAFYSCTFMTSEKTKDGNFSWGREYSSLFWQDDLGRYSIGDQYFMPIVRNVPTFPEGDVKLFSTWVSEASEAYDFSNTFGISKPVISPFEVSYKYSKKEKKRDKILHIIEAEYEKSYQVPNNIIRSHVQKKSAIWPIEAHVRSRQKIAFDVERGNVNYYDETFSITLILNNGSRVEYNGTSHAELEEILRVEKEENNEKIKENIEKLNLDNTSVEKTEKGLKIIIENIRFGVNSAVLQESEKEKLSSIAEILKKYGSGDILIEGHTVFSGTIEQQKELSEQRAKVVADYLIKMGVRDEKHIFTRGLAGNFPIVPNTTEENKARNRRVEIIIMD